MNICYLNVYLCYMAVSLFRVILNLQNNVANIGISPSVIRVHVIL